MSQPEVAEIMKVTTDTVTFWENNRNGPTAKFAKAVIDFLGYIPFKSDDLSLGKQFYYARLISGKTQKQVAELIGCDVSNLRQIELDRRKPQTHILKKILGFISTSGSDYLCVESDNF